MQKFVYQLSAGAKKAVESLLSRGVKYWQKPWYASESLSWLLEECKPGGNIDEFGEYAH